ncbi:MAG: flavodoxin-dependent (E)-4-hydroxy-3-methylbut-2-enyl-diphosphate synthase [Candidatus Omnitrophica bacterium]|nr:flavodoxin-dependent (E)-4-hydroxy-3-methylbut-2-enyl-diphosphate synthase [Candidatus Omnitrophota bacterium]
MRKSKVVAIGNVKIGGGSPVSIQTMVKSSPQEYRKILREIAVLKESGCQIVRIAYRDNSESEFLKKIIQSSPLPLEADIHFNCSLASLALEMGIAALRINPGNISKDSLKKIVPAAKSRAVPIRVGVNIGSLPENYLIKYGPVKGMVELVKEYVGYLEKIKFKDIIVSLKADSIIDTYEANLSISRFLEYPLHLGVTATGLGISSLVKSSIGIGSLLLQGIGDTIRVSLTESPLKEIEVAKEILSALGLRKSGIEVISCPGCGRAQIDILKLAQSVKKEMSKIVTDKYLKCAVMGCEVNGPGEAKSADIGVAGGRNCAILFKKGKIASRIKEQDILSALITETKKII